ncbi:MAG: type II toxin-antitoxin system mRNA interferase toxin, RelE/StbE family [Candidatus Nealsonbacteria bacterium CG08_land_8_20_14_0_20_38_20]|uniref:Type II toxin-antitoxin system mRNA interferase toxin, RelE/StbE family n=1 Tax=Candidatus Nealsonbacteria bacterium CG08_land_8_20_14_0_20_38_20 TaxID=1974705 RepID=A0A2H0YML9_9BACT|nr:MAG: type II toxin-antitoxin system mRNA interferase toxin, RelE/StbE family [Candidatus Nealsonbacteria bacterium CG08_land_8_20_14_0_20_38_20]
MKERRIKEVEYSNKFLKSLKRLPQKIIKEAEKKEEIFKENPFHPTLRTHKLSGKDKESWGFWITYSYRIKFIFLSDEEVLFLDIGAHDIYK